MRCSNTTIVYMYAELCKVPGSNTSRDMREGLLRERLRVAVLLSQLMDYGRVRAGGRGDRRTGPRRTKAGRPVPWSARRTKAGRPVPWTVRRTPGGPGGVHVHLTELGSRHPLKALKHANPKSMYITESTFQSCACRT